ncbi:MAG: glycosyltransferase [Bacteroidaceae bacterium]
MSKISIYLISVDIHGYFNGVGRHIQVFMNDLGNHTNVECYHLSFTQDPSLLSLRETRINKRCMRVAIPLPVKYGVLLKDSEALHAYNQEVCELTRRYFANKRRRILHVHTLNMMPFALLLKSKIRCKIVSHIHCLPWKYNLAFNPKVFGNQFEIAAQHNENEDRSQLFSVLGEKDTYNKSDRIICVADCGREFVKYMQGADAPFIDLIPNGIRDTFDAIKVERGNGPDRPFVIFFAGGGAKGKGLDLLLDGVSMLPTRTRKLVEVHVAGICSASQQSYYKKRYPNTRVVFLGLLNQWELEEAYYRADLGAIMSLHEQCSYTAIEMMMHQLPIISTDADGLGEMFQDGKNASVVPVEYNKGRKVLYTDKNILAQKLISLIHSPRMREKIGRKGRATFLEHYTAQDMSNKIINLYEDII